jgi:hypothetical protein
VRPFIRSLSDAVGREPLRTGAVSERSHRV